MLPTREEAMALIRDGLSNNPGPWGKHSLTAAHCAEKIAAACGDMDAEKAYVLGLLHDIGRKFGVRHLGHVSDGYAYMMCLGYDEAAKICLTHSFNNHTVDEYIGKLDVSEEEMEMIKTELARTVYDDYDRLIQLCDGICLPDRVTLMDTRLIDVAMRHGVTDIMVRNWRAFYAVKQHFDTLCGGSVYALFREEIVQGIFDT